MARATTKERTETASIATPSREDFAAMLEQSFQTQSPQEGSVIKRGTIVSIENDFAMVDVGQATAVAHQPQRNSPLPGIRLPSSATKSKPIWSGSRMPWANAAVADGVPPRESWIVESLHDQSRVSGGIFVGSKAALPLIDGAVAFLPGIAGLRGGPTRDVAPDELSPSSSDPEMDRRRGNIVVPPAVR